MKWVTRYLKGTKDTKLMLGKGGTLTWEEVERQSHSGVKVTVMLIETHRNIATPSLGTPSALMEEPSCGI